MGSSSQVVIHAEPNIPWHGPFAEKMRKGLTSIGIPCHVTASRGRESDNAVLLGTTLWRGIEATGDYLLVDRCSFGDTNEWVSLVWNGHGRRGDHRAKTDSKRWKSFGIEIAPWVKCGSRKILCGQHESYSPHYATVQDWYDSVEATHFRKHPVASNTTGLPLVRDFDDCDVAITLNSSIAVEAVMSGVLTVTMDEGAMAWDVTSHNPNLPSWRDRRPWLEWLAWTHWSHDEIQDGKPIKHLFEAI